MVREYVESSNISSIGFDKDNSILEVEFKSGAIWQYFDVPESIFFELKSASSIGRYFNNNIKGQYIESRVG